METPQPQSGQVPAFIRALMPEATDEELRDAHQTAKDYIDIVIRIFERSAREKEKLDSPESDADGRIRNK